MSASGKEEVVIPALHHVSGMFLDIGDMISWAWKGAAVNENPAVKQTFTMIAQQLEKASGGNFHAIR